jgi:hypothetical protein
MENSLQTRKETENNLIHIDEFEVNINSNYF